MALTTWARGTKHRAFVAYKRVRFPLSTRWEPWHRRLYARNPYTYRMEDFAAIGLGPVPENLPVRDDPVPRSVYCFWTGENDLTPNRRRNLERFREVNEPDGIEVVLVTPDNLDRYLAPDRPLHARYRNLHVVHRSDYLRAYFLHFFGGGYTDIKEPIGSWAAAFDRFDASSAWLCGPHKPSRYMSPHFQDKSLDRLMRRTSPVHVHQMSLLARPRTPLTAEWWQLLNATLDAANGLVHDPGTARYGAPGYPLAWTDVLGKLIDPLCVKYADHVRYDPDLRLREGDYL